MEMDMDTTNNASRWPQAVVLLARLILALVFLMAFAFKVMGIHMTADFIASAGFPLPTLLAILAAIFELAIVLSLLSGAYFSEMMLLGAIYALCSCPWPGTIACHEPEHYSSLVNAPEKAFQGSSEHTPIFSTSLSVTSILRRSLS
jgi:DoxX